MVGFAGIYGINNATEVVQLSASVVNHSASVVSQDGCWEGSATGDTWVIFDLGVSQEVTSVDLVRTDSCGIASQTTVYPTELAFSPSNWSFPRNVTVMPVDDELDEPTHHISTMEYTTLSDDLKYFNISIEKTTVHITDNDHARINIYQVVNASLGETRDCVAAECIMEVLEGGISQEYKIALNSEPRAEVYVTVEDWNKYGYGTHVFHRNGSSALAALDAETECIDCVAGKCFAQAAQVTDVCIDCVPGKYFAQAAQVTDVCFDCVTGK